MTNHSIVMLRRLQASKTIVCVYKILHFCTNLQKFQTLVPAKNCHLKVSKGCNITFSAPGNNTATGYKREGKRGEGREEGREGEGEKEGRRERERRRRGRGRERRRGGG